MEKAPNDWEGMLRATIGVLAIAGKYDELLKALKLKAQLEQASNAEGMYEQALLSLEVWKLLFSTLSVFSVASKLLLSVNFSSKRGSTLF